MKAPLKPGIYKSTCNNVYYAKKDFDIHSRNRPPALDSSREVRCGDVLIVLDSSNFHVRTTHGIIPSVQGIDAFRFICNLTYTARILFEVNNE